MKSKPTIRTGIFFLFFLFAGLSVIAQNMQLPNAFAHNDYRHKRPLHDALENGFTYVEADIYLRGNKLIVTHILPILKSNRTLEELYLKPLLEYVSKNKNGNAGNQSPITLVIDIKSDAQKTFAALLLLLEKYKTILSAYENGRVMLREVTVVITGNKPIELIKEKTNRLVFLDQDLRHVGMGITANTSPIASCKYSNILKWKGRGPISPVEKKRLCDFVNKAHQNGCKVRLWASPEKAVVWDELLRCNVDLINTNKLVKLRDFLVSENLSMANTEVPLRENKFPDIVSK